MLYYVASIINDNFMEKKENEKAGHHLDVRRKISQKTQKSVSK